jgi:hypothetical protein
MPNTSAKWATHQRGDAADIPDAAAHQVAGAMRQPRPGISIAAGE